MVFHLGDWVQAAVEIDDDGEVIAQPGDLGHVVSAPEADGWPNCYFERSGRVSICEPSEVMFLAPMDAGTVKPEKRTDIHVN